MSVYPCNFRALFCMLSSVLCAVVMASDLDFWAGLCYDTKVGQQVVYCRLCCRLANKNLNYPTKDKAPTPNGAPVARTNPR